MGHDSTQDGLARVGTQPEDLPEGAPGAGRRWWGAAAAAAGGRSSPGERKSGDWASSAKEEIDQFKGVPVVGGLPWRLQYLVFAVLLTLSVLGLLLASVFAGSASRSNLPPEARALSEQVRQTTGAQAVPAEFESRRAILARSETAHPTWGALNRAWSQWASAQAAVQTYASTAQAARQALDEGVLRATPAWTQAGQAGTWNTPEAVLLAQLMGRYRTLSARLAPVALGHSSVPANALKEDEQAIAQAFQAFRQSPMASQDTPVTRAWRETSAAWAAAAPLLAQLQTSSAVDAWTNRETTSQAASEAYEAMLLGSAAVGGGTVWKVSLAFLALGSLGLLLGVAWKQQRWQVLQAQAAQEQGNAGVTDLIHDLNAVGGGDLTKRARVSNSSMGTLADGLNKAVEQLRRQVIAIKATATETGESSVRANEATGVLIDVQRQRIAALESHGQDFLQLIESVSDGAREAGVAKALSEQARLAAEAGRVHANQLVEGLRNVREKVDEAISRTQRMMDSSSEVSLLAIHLKQDAEQLDILGIQAALQASKAGEAGQAFGVVARGIQELAESSGERARHVSSLVETSRSDLEILLASMASTRENTDAGSRSADLAQDAWASVVEQLVQLTERAKTLKDHTQQQSRLASVLDERTRADFRQVETQAKQVQEASEATLQLVGAVRKMEETVSRLKA